MPPDQPQLTPDKVAQTPAPEPYKDPPRYLFNIEDKLDGMAANSAPDAKWKVKSYTEPRPSLHDTYPFSYPHPEGSVNRDFFFASTFRDGDKSYRGWGAERDLTIGDMIFEEEVIRSTGSGKGYYRTLHHQSIYPEPVSISFDLRYGHGSGATAKEIGRETTYKMDGTVVVEGITMDFGGDHEGKVTFHTIAEHKPGDPTGRELFDKLMQDLDSTVGQPGEQAPQTPPTQPAPAA